MITTYLRSSSYGAYSMCPQAYFLDYVLGIPTTSGKAAEKGTIVHKVMEIIGCCKKVMQDGGKTYRDSELKKTFVLYNNKTFKDYDYIFADKFVNYLIILCREYYTESSLHEYTKKDINEIFDWTHKALTYEQGMFDPRKRHIIAVEQKFDFEIKEDWAKYDFVNPTNGEHLTGYLSLKGTMDLLTAPRDDIYELTDWKTGRRVDWATGEEKTYEKLCVDPQLRIYHLALSYLFPDIKQFLMTIYFIKDGGPFTLAYDKRDIKKTKLMLKRRFEQIQRTEQPHLNKTWKCTKFCHFGKNQHPKDPSKTMCEYIKDLTREKGMEYVVANETDVNHNIDNYQEPGGLK